MIEQRRKWLCRGRRNLSQCLGWIDGACVLCKQGSMNQWTTMDSMDGGIDLLLLFRRRRLGVKEEIDGWDERRACKLDCIDWLSYKIGKWVWFFRQSGFFVPSVGTKQKPSQFAGFRCFYSFRSCRLSILSSLLPA